MSSHRVPVAVKLSQRFYQKLGHDTADALVNVFTQLDGTYRSDLRKLNETNFSRFDAKLEQRLAESMAALRIEFHREVAGLRAELINWMFVFWMGNVATTAGLVLTLARLLRS